MEIPPKDNRKIRSSDTPGSSPKAKKRSFVARYVIPGICVLLGVGLLIFAGLRFVSITVSNNSTIERPISDVLNMADRHQLKAVTISGDDVTATDKKNLQYHAVKEDGQSVTEIFRRDGVQVNIDNGQRGQWTQ